ncbi:MAG: hypothetical protein INR68_14740 [Methylobacterium mesophilicum]|nr:hypothetical protein [Methylobacterium mesophilicum]
MALAASAPVMLADEKSFFHIPGVNDFRTQRITRAGAAEKNWPFTVAEGTLACAYVMGRPVVYFVEDQNEAAKAAPRTVIVSVDPMDLSFGNMGAQDLVAEPGDLAELIPRMAPFAQAGARLCEQPPGAALDSGEL